jgi:type VII secretion-associated serine protease mycosin
MRTRISTGLSTVLFLTLTGLWTMPARADDIRNSEWFLNYLHAPEAHQISRGEGVTVAVVDTGVSADQPDLSGNVLPGTNEYRGFSGDGRQDDDGHGTSMANIIAAHGRGPMTGALGIAPAAKILPVRDAAGGDAFPPDVRQSISWAVGRGAEVVCVAAVGGPGDAWTATLTEAYAADVVVVAAAGNRTAGGTAVGWPAAYPGVVAAGGIDESGRHAALSVTGPEVVLSAPAVDIVTAGLHQRYVRVDGTSAAAAIIAGAAALVRSQHPQLSAAEVIHRLEATATDAGPPGRDDEYGYGIVNLIGALTADVPPHRPTASPPTFAARPPANPAIPGAAPSTRNPLATTGILIAVLLAAGVVSVPILLRRQRR